MTASTARRPGYAERLLQALKDAGPIADLTFGDLVEAVLEVRDDELAAARGEALLWWSVMRRCRCNRPDAPADEPHRECPAHGQPEVMLDEIRGRLP